MGLLMARAYLWVMKRLTIRKCRGGCTDTDPHSHHLTWFGKRRYT